MKKHENYFLSWVRVVDGYQWFLCKSGWVGEHSCLTESKDLTKSQDQQLINTLFELNGVENYFFSKGK